MRLGVRSPPYGVVQQQTTYGMTKACAELLVNDCTRWSSVVQGDVRLCARKSEAPPHLNVACRIRFPLFVYEYDFESVQLLGLQPLTREKGLTFTRKIPG